MLINLDLESYKARVVLHFYWITKILSYFPSVGVPSLGGGSCDCSTWSTEENHRTEKHLNILCFAEADVG